MYLWTNKHYRDNQKQHTVNTRLTNYILTNVLTDGHHFDKCIQINHQCGDCGRHSRNYRGNDRGTGEREYLAQ